MAETFKLISNISFILAAVLFLVAVFMFFKFNIRKIVGDLSGRNARKSINAMKQGNQNNEALNVNYIYKRDIKEASSKLQLSTELQVKTEPLSDNLPGRGTDVLSETLNSTTVLGGNMVGTTVLSNAQLLPKDKQFVVTKEITFIHGAVTL